jgi:hypothetical protein
MLYIVILVRKATVFLGAKGNKCTIRAVVVCRNGGNAFQKHVNTTLVIIVHIRSEFCISLATHPVPQIGASWFCVCYYALSFTTLQTAAPNTLPLNDATSHFPFLPHVISFYLQPRASSSWSCRHYNESLGATILVASGSIVMLDLNSRPVSHSGSFLQYKINISCAFYAFSKCLMS